MNASDNTWAHPECVISSALRSFSLYPVDADHSLLAHAQRAPSRGEGEQKVVNRGCHTRDLMNGLHKSV